MNAGFRIWLIAQLTNSLLYLLISYFDKTETLIYTACSIALGCPSIITFSIYLYILWTRHLREEYMHFVLSGFPLLTAVNAIVVLFAFGASLAEIFTTGVAFFVLTPAISAWWAAYLSINKIKKQLFHRKRENQTD
jgi:hypothetical protein